VKISPGLYKHYKGNLYRVLLVACWSSQEAPKPDGVVSVWVSQDSCEVLVSKSAGWLDGVFDARWSGNDADVSSNEGVVVYVGIYGEGRVSARTEKEFDQVVLVPGGSDVRRFTRVGP
jgi:hypothetical protein